MSELTLLKLRGLICIGIIVWFVLWVITLTIKVNRLNKIEQIEKINKTKSLLTPDRIRNKILYSTTTGREFEEFLCKVFELQGYKVELTKATNDKGRDLILKEPETGKIIFVEAKRYSSENHVGREVIQKLLGACNMYGADEGYVVTTSSFTKTAIDCLKHTNNLELWDLDVLVSIIDNMSVKNKIILFNY